MLRVTGRLSPGQRLYTPLALGVLALGALWALHPTLRHVHPLAPIYSCQSVAEVRGLGLPIYPPLINRPYLRPWAGHHIREERGPGKHAYRFETRPTQFTEDWGDWEASRQLLGGEGMITVRVNLFDGVTHVFYYVSTASNGPS